MKSIGSALLRLLMVIVLSAGLVAAAFFVSGAPAFGRYPKLFPIEVRVDFGPAGKPVHEETLYVEAGTTPKEAVSQIFPILAGKACCSAREILAIDGVAIDPAKNRWWTCAVNGSKKLSPHKRRLRRGDKLEWRYIEDSQ